MKRLLDESPDELTRSLLVAGIEDRPAPGNQARVIAALGAGGALGLFSSNAFAWLGTTAGKVTAAGVTVGVAGALFVVVPQMGFGAASGSVASSKPIARFEAAPVTQQPPSQQPSFAPPGAEVVDTEAAARAVDSARLEPSVVSAEPEEAATASPDVKAATRRLASWREKRLLARKRAAAAREQASVARVPSSEPASEASAASANAPVATAALAAGSERPEAASPDLDSEVRLVDEMHRAARRNDREALGVFLARYRETFPHGQLEKEVAEFAVRLEQSDTYRTP